MELCLHLFLVLLLFGTQFHSILTEDDSLKDVKIRCYADGQITNYYEYALNESSISNLKLDIDRPTIFYVHGWNENVDESPTLSVIVNAFLQRNEHNVCVLNYEDLAAKFYTILFVNIPLLGERLASIIENWIENGVDPSQIHLIGYSIGPHMCGIAGRILQRFGYTIGRITGLDPANPMYCTSGNTPHPNSLNKSDANFVDVIHTDGGFAGCKLPLGHADFYPNGGTRPQPMCGNSIMQYVNMLFGDHCPHDAAAYYFADSVTATVPKYLATNRLNKQQTAQMGYDCPNSAAGLYDLVTK